MKTDMQGIVDSLKEIPEDERADFLEKIRPQMYVGGQQEMAPTVVVRLLIEKGLITEAEYTQRVRDLTTTYVDLLLNALGRTDKAEDIEHAAHAFVTGYLVEGLPKEVG